MDCTEGDSVKYMLAETEPGKRYVVTEIKDEARLVNRLSSMGVMCGSRIEVCQNERKQPVLIFTRDTLIAIGRRESEKIVVGDVGNE